VLFSATDQRALLGVEEQDKDLDRPLLLALAGALHLSPQQAVATQQPGHLAVALVVGLGTLSLPLSRLHTDRSDSSFIHTRNQCLGQLLVERLGSIGQQKLLGRQQDELHLLGRRGRRRGRRRRSSYWDRLRWWRSLGSAAGQRSQY
jgi:hypothetical protein